MNEKLDKLINAYNDSNITTVDGDSESSTVDYKIYKENEYTINLVLKKAEKYGLVVSLEKNKKFIYFTDEFECNEELYNEMVNVLDEEGLESYINKYFDLILKNVQKHKFR